MSGWTPGRGIVGWVGGIVAAVISGVLVVVLTTQEPAADHRTPPPECCRPTVDFVITDQLSEGQVTERIAVYVEGRSVGTLVVDVVHTQATLTVTVPEPGPYTYRLEGSFVFADEYGETVSRSGAGSGEITVSSGRTFALMGDYSSDPVWLTLR